MTCRLYVSAYAIQTVNAQWLDLVGEDVLDVLLSNLFASMLQALLEAEGKGETWKVLGPPAAPHLIGVDGEVRVPDRWENLIRGSEGYKEHVQQQKAAKAAARAAKSPSRTPPRSPISC